MFKMKRITMILAVAVIMGIAFSLTGCGESTTKNQSSASPAATATANTNGRDTTKLYVGMEVGYPPMEMVANDGEEVVGFDVDVAKEIAKRLGKTGGISIVQTAWDGIFTALETDKFDCIISAVSITPARQKVHSLTKAYVANKLILVTKKGDTNIKSPEDLLSGKKVGVQQSTTAEDYLKEMIADGKKVSYSPYQKVTQPFADLKIGRIDAVLVDLVVGGYYMVQDKESFQIAWESPEAEPMAVAFQKKDTATRDAVNKILDEMQKDGTMAKISKTWFAKDITSNLD